MEVTKTDFNFSIPILELVHPQVIGIHDEDHDRKSSQLDDGLLGEVDVPLSSKRIRQQVS